MDLYRSKYSGGKNSRRENDTTRSFRNSRSDRPPRYSRDDRGSRDGRRDESTTVTCSDCGDQCTVPFVPRTNKPVYCSDCFRDNKPQDYGNDRGSRDDRQSRYSQDDHRDESTTVTCSDCGDQCTVPFVPRTNKPVYCNDCFRKNKPQDYGNDRSSRDDRGSRYSRDDKPSRYSRDDRPSRDDRSSRYSRDDKPSRYSRDDRGSRSSSRSESGRDRSKKPRNDKFLRKQESFYSNGSDKFYETIKEKLYEILGGKTCSNCGFKDERALGISPISDGVTSDSSGRGGDAASWGKYISAPDLARAELKVFCLNCNQIREPVQRQTQDRPRSKKSKYFPR